MKIMAPISWRYLVLLLFCVEFTYCVMTEAQINATPKLMRRSCKSKMKITSDEELDGMREGKWENISPASKCYLQCCLQMIKLVNKDGFIDIEAGMKASKRLPPETRVATESAIESCKNAGMGLIDKCDIAYNICKCLHDFDPKYYLIT